MYNLKTPQCLLDTLGKEMDGREIIDHVAKKSCTKSQRMGEVQS